MARVTDVPVSGVGRHASAVRRLAPWMAGLALLAGAMAIDGWAYHHIVLRNVYDFDWGRALRTMGYWPVWAALALALWLRDRAHPRPGWRAWERASVLLAAVSVAGLVDELLKVLFRRDRPSMTDGGYAFRAWSDHPLSTSGFGLPSSHAVEAFAAATVLTHLWPEARMLWWALAIGCGLTRVLSGAHFVSDVVAGALVGVATATMVMRVVRRAGRSRSA